MKNIHLFISPLLFLLSIFFMAGNLAADQNTDFNKIEKAISKGDMLEAQSLLEDFIDEYPAGRRSIKALYFLGQLHYRQAAYKDAATIFSKIIKEHPEWEYADRTLYGLAMSQMGMLNYPSASASLESFLRTYRQSELRPDALYWLAEALYRRGDYSAALSKYNEFLKLHPSHGLREFALDSSAWCLEQLGKYNEAMDKRREFLNQFKDSSLRSAAEFCLAADLAQMKKPDAAIERLSSIAKSDSTPGSREQALLTAGILLAQTGKDQESIVAFEGMSAEPGGSDYFLGQSILANIYLRTGAYKKAVSVSENLFKKAKAPKEKCDAGMQLALADFGLGNYKDASEILSSIEPQSQETTVQREHDLLLAVSLLNSESPAVAADKIAVLVPRKESEQTSPDLLFMYGGSLILSQRFHQAGEIFAKLSKDVDYCSGRPEVFYYHGLCLSENGDFSGAAGEFDKFIKSGNVQQLLPHAHFLLAYSYGRTGKLEESLKWYLLFLENWPNHSLAPPAYYQAGLSSLLLKKNEAAIALLDRSIAGHPSDAASEKALFFMGIAHLRNGDAWEAADLYESLMHGRMDAGLADGVALGYGLAEFEAGRFEKAGQIFAEFPSRFPDSEVIEAAMFFAAASRYAEGAIKNAGTEFCKLAELFPSGKFTADTLLEAGICEEKLDHPENALALYGQALQIELSPAERSAILMRQAFANMSMGNPDQALKVFSAIVEQHQKDSVAEYASFWTGRLLYSSGRWQDARQALEKFVVLFPDSRLVDEALFFAARAARMGADYHRAADLFHQLNTLSAGSPFSDQAYVEAAECMLEAGEAVPAIKEFQDFIEKNVSSPLRPVVLYDMGKALQRSGKFEDAIDQFKAAAGGQTTELAASSHFAVAECLAELDRSDEAIAELVGMVRGAYPPGWAERAQLQVARLLERNGQVEEARHVYAAVAQTYRIDAAGIVAKRALDRLDAEK
jgi:TolA-binding protein